MSVTEEVLSFITTREPWQQDVIRRLWIQAEFTEQDYDDALRMLKAQHGLIAEEGAPTPEPLTADQLPYRATVVPKTILNSMADIKNTNRLAKGQTLRFGIDGVTIIYGDNGSGKSGYCRVLKKMCRVRKGGEEKICGNVFEANAHPPAEATVGFTEENAPLQTVSWCDGAGVPDSMSLISVFDSRTVPIYANQQNEIEFLPEGLDLLPRLGHVCKELAGRLDVEIGELLKLVDIPLPQFPEGTKVSSVLDKLSTQTPIEQLPSREAIENLGKWSSINEQELGAKKTGGQVFILHCFPA